jgi:CBS domain-containing protein
MLFYRTDEGRATMQASDIMTRDVITVQEDDHVDEAVRKLAEYQLSGLPVLDRRNAMVGIVTEADVLSRSGDRVNEIMTRRVISVDETAAVEYIAQLLTGNRIKRVPVVDGDRVVGIVSRADIVRTMASRWVCGTCGAIHLGAQPAACEACGAPGHGFTREFPRRMEINPR